jgi:glucosyltransferase
MGRTLSVVVPCYNEADMLPQFFSALQDSLTDLTTRYDLQTESIFVDDGSADATLEMIRDYALSNHGVQFLSFSRNFGKEAAMLAGLQHAKGDLVVIMDADLQDSPRLMDIMVRKITEEGYDCVAAHVTQRKGQGWIRASFSNLFYWLHNRISNITIVPGARDYRMMTRPMVDAILSLTEYNRFTKGIFSWVGFNTYWLEMESIDREKGSSKWSFFSLASYAFDGITAFSTSPLQMASWVGLFFCFVAVVMIVVVVAKTLLWGDPVAGFPTLISTVMFLGGIQLFCIGLLGQYLARTYLETKNRPHYIIRETGASASEEE